ncbi:MAG: 2OG-Fe(II) oxygenase superfamily protein [Verrucomicrobia bacterium]|nr:MAG: 2OG-Fe(II) oxygenase superfamily protein [Verrucomicrobiota bacterium]
MSASPHEPLLKALDTVTGTGVFCATGSEPFFMPELVVEGVGELAFPLIAAQVSELVRAGEAAPYGKGLSTVQDDHVRKCRQIDAAKLSLHAPEWQHYLQRTVDKAAKDLGIDGEVTAELYKLLIYQEGGHFLPHRDTEKLAAMFGTLIVALPSAHEGGRLLVRHGGEEVAVDFSQPPGLRRFQSAALFADCEHEVEKVTSGVRCCLVYNLVLTKGNPDELNRPLSEHSNRLLPALKAMSWPAPVNPAAILLDHQYTEANFSLRNLKGDDSARARALLSAADAAGLTASLALVTFHRLGELQGAFEEDYNSYRYRTSRYREDGAASSDDQKMGEIYEESLGATHWRDALDRPLPRGAVSLNMESLIYRQPIDAGKPLEQDYEGYTGNAGCTLDYWYRRAAVVFWPRDQHEAILVSLDPRAACAELAAMAPSKAAADRPEFQRLLAAILTHLPDAVPRFQPSLHQWKPRVYFASEDADFREPFAATLEVIAMTGLRSALTSLLRMATPSVFATLDRPLWHALVRAFGSAPFQPIVSAWLAESPASYRMPLFLVLDAICAANEPDAALALTRKLVTLPALPSEDTSFRTSFNASVPGCQPEALIILRASIHLTNPKDKEAALAFLEADGSLPSIRQHLAPALLEWAATGTKLVPDSVPAAALALAITILSREVARPMEPYRNWTRPCPVPESSDFYGRPRPIDPLLTELRTFMADPNAATHDFLCPQAERDRIEDWVRRFHLDLDTVTIRTGRPYTLRCTKTSMSHQHSLQQRAEDLTLLSKLMAI